MKIKSTLIITGVLFLFVAGGFAWGMFGSASTARAGNALQSNAEFPRTITVVGEGQVSGPPDIALVNLGVQVVDPDVKAATQQAASQMESLLAALRNEGIADKDIQTSYYNLYVDRPYDVEGGQARYQISNSMQITVRDLSKLTEILGIAIEAGANNINSVEFKLSDSSQLRAEARAQAVNNAQERAEELAELNDVAVGQVVSISEVVDSGAYFVSEQRYDAAAGFGGGGGGPISPGNVTINAQIQITYGILQ